MSQGNIPIPDGPPPGARNRALIGLGFAAVIAVTAFVMLSRAADVGVARVARIDRQRAQCDSLMLGAASATDTARIDRTPLADTIDAGSDDPLARCGDLRRDRTSPASPGAGQGNREMPQRLTPEQLTRPPARP